MQVSREELHETFSRKPSGELRRIVESPEGEYTPEAVAIARELLGERAPESAETEGSQGLESAPNAVAPEKADSWSGIGGYLVMAYGAKQLFYMWQSAERNPQGLVDSLSRVASSPWPYAVAGILTGSLWRRWSARR